MKKILPMIFVLTLSTMLLVGCTVSAQSAASTEASARPEQLTDSMSTVPEAVAYSNVSAAQAETAISADLSDLCAVCDDNACDGGKHCDGAKGTENRTDNTPCPVCGDYNCNDGIFCDDTGARRTDTNHHADRHSSHHG